MTEPSARDRELAEQLKPLLLNATVPWEECAAKLATLLAAARAEGADAAANETSPVVVLISLGHADYQAARIVARLEAAGYAIIRQSCWGSADHAK